MVFLPSLSSSNALVAILSGFMLRFLVLAVYHVFFSRLRHIPGPWYAAISDAWLITQGLCNRQTRAVQSLFDLYGPVVRIAPGKIAYFDLPSNKRIYGNSKFPKGIFYKSVLTNDNDSAFVYELL